MGKHWMGTKAKSLADWRSELEIDQLNELL